MTPGQQFEESWVCSTCGASCSDDGSACTICGSAPVRRVVAVETCHIARWRGYVSSSFYAVTPTGEALVESRSFRWRKAEAPPESRSDARAALDELVAVLEADGWVPAGAVGREWFARRFTRPLGPVVQDVTGLTVVPGHFDSPRREERPPQPGSGSRPPTRGAGHGPAGRADLVP